MIPTPFLALIPLMLSLPAEAGSRWLKNDDFVGDRPEEVTFMGGFVAGECWASVYIPSSRDYPFTPKYVDMLVAGGSGTANFSVEIYGLDGTDMTTASLLGEGVVTLTSSASEWNRVRVSELGLTTSPIVGGNLAVAVCHEDHDGFPSIGHDSSRDAGELSYIWGEIDDFAAILGEGPFGVTWWTIDEMATYDFAPLYTIAPTGDWIMRACIDGGGISGACEDTDPTGDDSSGGTDGTGSDGGGSGPGSSDGSADGGGAPIAGSCLTALGCADDVAFDSCEDFGGTWFEGETCPGSCTTSLGCTDDVSLDSCDDFGGAWATAPCPPPAPDDDTETPVDCSSVGPDECGDFETCMMISGFLIDIDEGCITSGDTEDVGCLSTDLMCADVISYAAGPDGRCMEFMDSCIPTGWYSCDPFAACAISGDETGGDATGGDDGDDTGGDDASGDDDTAGGDDAADDTGGDDTGEDDGAADDTGGDTTDGGGETGGSTSEPVALDDEDKGDTESKGGCSHIGAVSSMHISWIGLLILAARRRQIDSTSR